MASRLRSSALLLCASLATGCSERNLPLAAGPEKPAFAVVAKTQCAANPDFVVSTLQQLNQTLATAPAGSIVAIQGTIAVVEKQTPLITRTMHLTCAAPGSGLAAAARHQQGDLLVVRAPRAMITGLRLDASEMSGSTTVIGLGMYTVSTDVQFTDNDVYCGTICVFLQGAARAVLTDNRMYRGTSAGSGIHAQAAGSRGQFHTDSTRIERNWISADLPSPNQLFGGIRVRDGVGVLIAHNTVTGPWANSIAVANVDEAVIEHNELDGAVRFGIGLNLPGTVSEASVPNVRSTVRNNTIRNAGLAGMHVRNGCFNLFLANTVRNSPNAIAFDAKSGANLFVGNHNTVADAGAFDCNADGTNDPNTITGPNMVRYGPLGFAIVEGIQQGGDVR